MRRLGSDTWVFVGLAVFVVLIAMLAGGGRQSASDREIISKRTTYSPKPGGLKALYTTLHDLGYPTRRQLTDLVDDPQDGVLFVVSPDVGLSQSEWGKVESWVQRGNVLIVAGHALSEVPYNMVDFKESASSPVCPSSVSAGTKAFSLTESDRIDSSELSLKDLYGLAKPFG